MTLLAMTWGDCHAALAAIMVKNKFFIYLHHNVGSTHWVLSRKDGASANAAIMMFCYNPEKFFPRTQVDIVIFPKGKDEDPGHFIELPPITGPVHLIIRKTLEYLRTMILRQKVEKISDNEHSKVIWNYPYQAIEEAVVNALYHRSYQEREPVEINIMPNQIEIISYSGPDRSLNINDLKSGKRVRARRYRNSRLGDFLKELRLTEGRGTGLPTIHKELKENGSPEAMFDVDEDRTYFLISIPCHKEFVCEELAIDEDGLIVEKVSEKISEKVSETGPAGALNPDFSEKVSEKVSEKRLMLMHSAYTAIAKNSRISNMALAAKLGVSHVTTQKVLNLLITRGYIQRQGRTRGASWIVLKEF